MRIHVIETGRVQIKASQIVGRGHGLARRVAPLFDATWSDWLPVNAYAIEHRDGVILVDTGVSAGVKRLPRWHPYFRFCVLFDVEPEEEAGPQLKALGIGSADVKRVVLTHLHIDHDGGLGHFPMSQVLVSPAELQHASGAAGRLRGYLPQRWPKAFDPKPLNLDDGPYGPFPRSKRLTLDGAIVAVATPGHTSDHLSVVVEDHDKTIFIAGDASYNEETMLEGTIDGVSDNEDQAAATLAAIRAFVEARPTIYLPAHDPGARRRLAEPRVAASRQSITACAAASSRETGAADFGERISASSGKAQSAMKVMNRKSFE